jgi:hypothetical protein
MPYQVFQIANFGGGLNLRDKADTLKENQAVDLLNVEFSDVGAVRQRDGFVEFTGTALTNRVDSLGVYYKADGTRQLLAGCGTRLEGINTSGAVIDSETGLAGGPYTFARFAAPGSEFVYAGNGTDTLRKWDGSTWTAPTATVDGVAAQAMPEAGAICLTANSDRLVATGFGTNTTGGPDATASNPSRVYFSDAANPESWTTTFWVDLHPGDGEQIMGAVTWRNFTFVFKESKFFVFTEEGQDIQGLPVFNKYAVDTGVGLAAKQALCVSREGVYFMSRQGVYFTNGTEPRLLSELVEPMWRGNAEVYFQSDEINQAQIALSRLWWHDERLYLAVPTGTATANNRVLVYDIKQGWWSLYDLPCSAGIAWRMTDQPQLMFGYSSGGNEIGRLSATAVTDNTVTITSRWRSGWGDFGIGVKKTMRQTKIWGTGAATVKFSTDFNDAPDQSVNVLFGSSTAVWPSSGTWATFILGLGGVWPGGGAVSSELVRKAVDGTVFSTQFLNNANDTGWAVHRVARHMRGQRIPSAA